MFDSIFSLDELYEQSITFYTEQFGVLGGFVLAFIENMFPPLPIFAIVIANVSAFGLIIGFLISFLGHYAGATVVFLFIRNVIKPRVDKRIKPDSKIKRFEKWVAKREFHTLLVILSLPFIPYFLTNISAGISNVSKKKYLLALGIGNFLMTLFLSVVGVTFDKAMSEGNYTALIYPALLIVVAYVIGKVIETKVDLK